ncbi:Lrp/AsnC family transcriptional regulator [Xanthomonas sp. XNM01]|jgi:Lrp/AsnC family leucine-responsive transcriptional regulator|uniref:Lrp/AsnC family transcriptional regulator n=1 Tax=Xanthomonas sp. XNM01 TaxID=2769289 RepID=UPI0017861E7C|nr:Lrp/AsnC family transcriptional regulator [Xanthomonas sp. XNM01]MBD9369900.1 Lrp/AsnC family transcriptional regulator [Xanthomonas sp. XNM01]
MSALDSFDVRILEALQVQGDMTMAELSERVHLSHSQCSRRVKQLRDTGLIRRFAAILDATRLGLHLKAYITVTLKHNSQTATDFRALIRDTAEILECTMVTGDGDFLLKAYTRDLPHFRDLLDRLAQVDVVATMRSVIVIEDLKNTSALPVYPQAAAG